jgi:AcrR family transcriptional regulator
MRRAKRDTKERIIEAATKLFSAQGFSGTSTRELARLADVNETSLFRHFPSKQDLFWAALQSRLEGLRVGKELQKALSKGGQPEQVLPRLIELLVNISAYEPELLKLLAVAFLELRPGAERIYRRYLTPIYQAIAGYLQQHVEDGTLQAIDPWIAAVAFVSSVFAHQGFHVLLTGSAIPFSNTEEAISAYSRFWLKALMAIPRELTVRGELSHLLSVTR